MKNITNINRKLLAALTVFGQVGVTAFVLWLAVANGWDTYVVPVTGDGTILEKVVFVFVFLFTVIKIFAGKLPEKAVDRLEDFVGAVRGETRKATGGRRARRSREAAAQAQATRKTAERARRTQGRAANENAR